MAANVENMFYFGETPWHGLGVEVKAAPTSKDAIMLAGLDWEVAQYPAAVQVPDLFTGRKGYVDVPTDRYNVRTSDNMVLGRVSNRYSVCQNRDAFDFTDALLGEGVTYETAGSLANGKRVWLLARTEGRIITDEKVDPYLVFTNSHDGKSGIQVAISPVRVVCQNTLNLALSQASRSWSTCHKGDVQSKLNEARATLMHTEQYLDELGKEFEELKMQRLSDTQVRGMILQMFPTNTEMSDKAIARAKQDQYDLWDIYARKSDLDYEERSAFRFVNAVSDFSAHKVPARKTEDWKSNKFLSIVSNGDKLIDTAFDMVKQSRIAV